MKTTLKQWGYCALLAASVGIARADSVTSVSPAKPGTTTTLPGAPTTVLQPPPTPPPPAPAPADGVDFSTSDPEEVGARTMEIVAEHREHPQATLDDAQRDAATRANNNDWMLRDYEARLKKAGLATTADTDPSLLGQPSTPSTAATDPLLSPPDSTKPQPDGMKLNTPAQDQAPVKLKLLTSLQPLLPALDSPMMKAPRDAWGTRPIDDDDATALNNILPPPAVTSESNHPTSSLDIPGLTAAQSGMGAVGALDFPQDPLPDESPATTSARQKRLAERNNFLLPTVPASDVSEFFRKQAEALQPPTAPNVIRPLTVTAKPATPYVPRPMAKPAISGLRSHVADPFDLLNR